jgi:molybdenum-dependent DNA-binding transcriptional regulator ModE
MDVKERISMSQNELTRLHELRKVHERRQTIAQAAKNLGLSQRQVKRLSKRLRNEGAEGLVSRKVGRSGNHQLPAGLKELAISLILEHYRDFGPTLAHEYLSEKHALAISISSVRNVMVVSDIWTNKARRKMRIHQLRPRRPREGELIQLDGSEHAWLEERGPYCTLLSYIDDATSKIMFLRFAKSESIVSYFEATQMYIQKHGRPETLYPDKHGVFRVNREGALTGDGMTQFGRAMKELGIELICANTPQAKGRVERRHRDLQDRLIKAMRLQKIETLEEANAFLPSFIDDFNKRFAKPPHDAINAHTPLLATHNLDRIFVLKTARRLSKNLTLQYKNVIYQIITDRPSYAMRKAEVTVLESRDGVITIEYGGRPITAVPYHQMQARAEVVSAKELITVLESKPEQKYRPGRHHPWKLGRRGFSARPEALACC